MSSGVGSTEPPRSVGPGFAGAGAGRFALETRNQLVGLFGIVERNVYLTKRYFLWDIAFMFWTIANTLTIVFIARGAAVGGRLAAADHRGARDADRPGDLQGRRAVREAAREAEAVGMIDLREA